MCTTIHQIKCQVTTLRSGSICIQSVIVYNPSGQYNDNFEDQFTELVEYVDSLGGKPVYLGDFNFHVDDANDASAKKVPGATRIFEFGATCTMQDSS